MKFVLEIELGPDDNDVRLTKDQLSARLDMMAQHVRDIPLPKIWTPEFFMAEWINLKEWFVNKKVIASYRVDK